MRFLLPLLLLVTGVVQENPEIEVTQVLTAAQADEAWGSGCKPIGVKAVKFDGLLFNWINHSGAIEAFIKLGDIFTKHGYEVRAEDTGTYNCRFIKGTTTPSRHGKPTAIDVNWTDNPAGARLVTDIPAAIINEAVAMRTNSGEQVWRWGGDWDTRPDTPHGFYDAMHFELIAHPDDLDTGIAEGGDDMALTPKEENTVRDLLAALEANGAGTQASRQGLLDRMAKIGNNYPTTPPPSSEGHTHQANITLQ